MSRLPVDFDRWEDLLFLIEKKEREIYSLRIELFNSRHSNFKFNKIKKEIIKQYNINGEMKHELWNIEYKNEKRLKDL